MKTSNVLASVLFGTLAAAAPLNKRAYATLTHTVVETVLVYTTVWDGEAPSQAPATATSFGAFYESPSLAAPSSAAASSTTPAYTPPVPTPTPESSSVYTPPPAETPSPEPTPSSVYTPPPVATPSPAPEPSSVYTPPAAVSTVAAAPAPSATTSSSGSGETYEGGSITMNYYGGGTGACGKPIADTDMIVALGVDLFGASSYDPATGNPTNKWCNTKIEISYKGATAQGTIMDRCPGCTGPGLDLTPALWQAVTGGVGGASGDRLSGATWKVVS